MVICPRSTPLCRRCCPRLGYRNPVINQDFADPEAFEDNGVVYFFSTNAGGANIQVGSLLCTAPAQAGMTNMRRDQCQPPAQLALAAAPLLPSLGRSDRPSPGLLERAAVHPDACHKVSGMAPRAQPSAAVAQATPEHVWPAQRQGRSAVPQRCQLPGRGAAAAPAWHLLLGAVPGAACPDRLASSAAGLHGCQQLMSPCRA